MMVAYKRGGMRGLGATCQVPRPGQTMFYPACETVAPAGPQVTSIYGPSDFNSGYVAPVPVGTPNCASNPNLMFTPECIETVLAAQHANQAGMDAANRAVFLKNCHDMIANENISRRARGLPLQVDDCDERTFGQTLPGTSGSAVQAPIAPVYQAVIASKSEIPAVAAAELAVEAAGASNSAKPGYVSDAEGFLGGSVPVVGYDFPMWGLLAAGAAALFFMGGRR